MDAKKKHVNYCADPHPRYDHFEVRHWHRIGIPQYDEAQKSAINEQLFDICPLG